MKYKAYDITTFEREPGKWRASIARSDSHEVTCYGATMESFITSADTTREEDAIQLAKGAIDGGHVK
jgi:hypothetical protein